MKAIPILVLVTRCTAGILATAILAVAPALALDGWSPGRITDVRIQRDQVLIKQEGALNPGNCPSAEYFMIPLDEGDDKNLGIRIMVSSLTSLMLMGNQGVEFGLEGCAPYPVVVELNISDGRNR